MGEFRLQKIDILGYSTATSKHLHPNIHPPYHFIFHLLPVPSVITNIWNWLKELLLPLLQFLLPVPSASSICNYQYLELVEEAPSTITNCSSNHQLLLPVPSASSICYYQYLELVEEAPSAITAVPSASSICQFHLLLPIMSGIG